MGREGEMGKSRKISVPVRCGCNSTWVDDRMKPLVMGLGLGTCSKCRYFPWVVLERGASKYDLYEFVDKEKK